MKRLLGAAMMVALLSGPGFAVDTADTSCAFWNRQDDSTKTAIMFGWMLAAVAADAVTRGEMLSKLVPNGHRVGSLVLEMNAECREPGNLNQTILQSMAKIIVRFNGVSAR